MSRYSLRKPGLAYRFGVLDKHTGPDFIASYGPGCDRADANLLLSTFNADWAVNGQVVQKSLVSELEARGYDTKTVRFTIQKRKASK